VIEAQNLFLWVTDNPLTASAVLFGGGVVAVTLFTYFQDYVLAKPS
jgi:hypothetical protein